MIVPMEPNATQIRTVTMFVHPAFPAAMSVAARVKLALAPVSVPAVTYALLIPTATSASWKAVATLAALVAAAARTAKVNAEPMRTAPATAPNAWPTSVPPASVNTV